MLESDPRTGEVLVLWERLVGVVSLGAKRSNISGSARFLLPPEGCDDPWTPNELGGTLLRTCCCILIRSLWVWPGVIGPEGVSGTALLFVVGAWTEEWETPPLGGRVEGGVSMGGVWYCTPF